MIKLALADIDSTLIPYAIPVSWRHEICSSVSSEAMNGMYVAAGMLAHAIEIREKGARYCDCAACVATHELLAKHGPPVL